MLGEAAREADVVLGLLGGAHDRPQQSLVLITIDARIDGQVGVRIRLCGVSRGFADSVRVYRHEPGVRLRGIMGLHRASATWSIWEEP